MQTGARVGWDSAGADDAHGGAAPKAKTSLFISAPPPSDGDTVSAFEVEEIVLPQTAEEVAVPQVSRSSSRVRPAQAPGSGAPPDWLRVGSWCESAAKNEDRHHIASSSEAEALGADGAFLVCDGHAGPMAADVVISKLFGLVAQYLGPPSLRHVAPDGFDERLERSVAAAFTELDKEVEATGRPDGCTATIVLVRMNPGGEAAVRCYWVGDSRAVIGYGTAGKRGVEELTTVPHHPAVPSEFRRLASFYASERWTRHGVKFADLDLNSSNHSGVAFADWSLGGIAERPGGGSAHGSERSAGGDGFGDALAGPGAGSGREGTSLGVTPCAEFLAAVQTEQTVQGPTSPGRAMYKELVLAENSRGVGMAMLSPRKSREPEPSEGSAPRPPAPGECTVEELSSGDDGTPNRTPTREGSSAGATCAPSSVQRGRSLSFVGYFQDEEGTRVGKPRLFGGDDSGSSLNLSRSIGDLHAARAVTAEPEAHAATVPAGDCARVVVASDGIWDVYNAKRTLAYCSWYRDPSKAAKRLVRAAKESRKYSGVSNDDITAIVVDIKMPARKGGCFCG